MEEIRQILRNYITSQNSLSEIDQAFLAWLLPDLVRFDLSDFAQQIEARSGATRTYKDVAILGFLADAGVIDGKRVKSLEDGLNWLTGRTLFVDGIPTGICVDPVATVGVTLGTKVIGNETLKTSVLKWIKQFISSSFHLRGIAEWQKCLFAASNNELDILPSLEMPTHKSVADVRIALLVKNFGSPLLSEGVEQDLQIITTLNGERIINCDETPRILLSLKATESIDELKSKYKLNEKTSFLKKEANKMLNILFLGTNPKDTDSLRLDEEIREIKQRVNKAQMRDLMKIEQEWAVRISDLQEHFLRHRPNIVHFSGHGNSTGELVLENKDGVSETVSQGALKKLFSIFNKSIKCVVLNACFSDSQAQAIAEVIDCVIGMTDSIGDEAAIAFASSFYQALGFGENVQVAFDLACLQIEMDKLQQEHIPKLFSKQGVDPSQVTLL